MGFFIVAKGKIFPHLQYFIIFFFLLLFFFNQMPVKLQKAGKVLRVLCSYLINAVSFSSPEAQNMKQWGNYSQNFSTLPAQRVFCFLLLSTFT